DDGELALGAHLLGSLAAADEDAEPMVVRLVLDDGRELEAVDRVADRRLDPDTRQLVLEHERIAVAARGDEAGHCRLATGTERVEVAHVRLVLEREQRRDLVERPRRLLGPERFAPRPGEAGELDELSVDETPARVGERVDERAADAERLPLDVVEGAAELLVADEHVAVHLVARAAADGVVRVVTEQVAPGELEI